MRLGSRTMKTTTFAAVAALILASPIAATQALAEGDAAAGEKAFNRCKSCHSVVAEDGTAIIKGGRTGPNLYGIIGQQAGTVEDFRYGDSLVAAGEAGLVWDEATLVSYLEDPRKFLVEYLDDKGARSKMAFRLKSGGEDIYAFLAQAAE